jgi:hypothetical protein
VRIRAIGGVLVTSLLIVGCDSSPEPVANQKKVGPYGPRRSSYAVSRCMRANGVSHFPDPGSFTGGAGGEVKQVPLPDDNTPAFKHAVPVCGHGGTFNFRAG